jgi:predicted Na+-dependent transporter
MSGITEILLIIAIILGLFMLPRIMTRKPEEIPQRSVRRTVLSGGMRFALLASVLWPVLVSLVLQPWNGRWVGFLVMGAAPVALSWGGYWVWSGFRREGK